MNYIHSKFDCYLNMYYILYNVAVTYTCVTFFINVAVAYTCVIFFINVTGTYICVIFFINQGSATF